MRPSHPTTTPGEIDFRTWHKNALSRDSYCMDVDKVEYRIDACGALRVVGIYELIRWRWRHDLDGIPERLAPYEGKLALLPRISESIAADQGSTFPTFSSGTGRTCPSSWLVGWTTGSTLRGRRSAWVARRSPG